MKVSYKLLTGGGWTVLFEVGRGSELLAEFEPQFTATNQEEPVYQSNAQFRDARGNVRTALPLNWNAAYTSMADSMASIRILVTALVGQVAGVGKVFHLKVEEGTETQYYPNAVVSTYHAKMQGTSCQHDFQLATDAVTGTEPS